MQVFHFCNEYLTLVITYRYIFRCVLVEKSDSKTKQDIYIHIQEKESMNMLLGVPHTSHTKYKYIKHNLITVNIKQKKKLMK